jgi:hypothetical protein
MERLLYSSLLEVQYGGESNNKKASEKAKTSDEFYVLLVELAQDPFASPTTGRNKVTRDSVWIDFSLFSPTTGKIKSRGRSELRPELLSGSMGNRNSRRYCFSNLTNDDYLLLEASYEVAERVMSGFSLPVPPIKCNRSLFYTWDRKHLWNQSNF